MRLHRPRDRQPERRPIAQEPAERVLLVRRGDHQDLADTRQHERRQRVVDHRLVVHGQQLLAHRERERMQPRAGAAGQDDPLHDERVFVSTLRAARELAPPASAAARWNTASSIGRVSRPVNVFCWLGWYEERSTSPEASRCSAPCPNDGLGRGDGEPARRLGGEHRLVCDAPEGDRHLDSRQQRQLGQQPAPAGVELRAGGLVGGRRAAGSGRHPCVAQHEAVVTIDRRRLIREAGAMQGRVEPVPALVAGEDASRPVSAVRRRGEPDDQDARRGIAESGNRAPPVRPVAEASDALPGDAGAMGDQPRTQPAAHQPLRQAGQAVTRRRGLRP